MMSMRGAGHLLRRRCRLALPAMAAESVAAAQMALGKSRPTLLRTGWRSHGIYSVLLSVGLLFPIDAWFPHESH